MNPPARPRPPAALLAPPGTWIEIAAIAVALVTGIAALLVGNRRPALS